MSKSLEEVREHLDDRKVKSTEEFQIFHEWLSSMKEYLRKIQSKYDSELGICDLRLQKQKEPKVQEQLHN